MQIIIAREMLKSTVELKYCCSLLGDAMKSFTTRTDSSYWVSMGKYWVRIIYFNLVLSETL